MKAGPGRPRGSVNKSTKDVRAAVALFAEANVANMQDWLVRVAESDPKAALDLYLKALEYHIPKLARSEQTGEGGGPVRYVFEWETKKG